MIKGGKVPESFIDNINKFRQKDINARWTQKNNQNYFGYKNHIGIDVKHKLIRSYKITSANVSDINCFDDLFRAKNTDKKIWADSAYFSTEKEHQLEEEGYESRIISRNKNKLSACSEKSRENTRRSKIRVRVEHVFGFITNTMRTELIRGVGILRASTKLGLTNLIYNFCRFEQLTRLGIA